jgi:hypothetical protein
MQVVALSREGGISYWNLSAHQSDAIPYRPSRYLDWLAISPYEGGFLALASDGNLCAWKCPDRPHYVYEEGADKILGPSRIDARLVADLW